MSAQPKNVRLAVALLKRSGYRVTEPAPRRGPYNATAAAIEHVIRNWHLAGCKQIARGQG